MVLRAQVRSNTTTALTFEANANSISKSEIQGKIRAQYMTINQTYKDTTRKYRAVTNATITCLINRINKNREEDSSSQCKIQVLAMLEVCRGKTDKSEVLTGKTE